MLIKNVEDLVLEEFTTCFDEAFSDYVIPFQVSPEQLADKFSTGRIRLDFGTFLLEF